MKVPRTRLALFAWTILAVSAAAQQPGAPADPLIRENATVRVSDHVYLIPDFNVGAVPNVGIVVGSRATLVVDTGLGTRNGQAVLREMNKVSANAEVYVVSTHFHPEHALGESAFPASAKLVRARAQQQDIDEFGLAMARVFAGRSPAMAALLENADFRKADLLFDKEHVLDLGGVRVRLMWMGPTHTRGDTVVWVEGERILFAGDVVMNRRFLAFASPYASVRTWLTDLDQLKALKPAQIIPSHGAMGDAALIDEQRAVMGTIQLRAAELKRQGKSADEAAKAVQAEMQARHPDWTGAGQAGNAARVAYDEAR